VGSCPTTEGPEPSSRHRNTSFRHSLYSPFPSSFDREGATLFCHGEYFDAPHGTGLAELPHPALQLPSLRRRQVIKVTIYPLSCPARYELEFRLHPFPISMHGGCLPLALRVAANPFE